MDSRYKPCDLYLYIWKTSKVAMHTSKISNFAKDLDCALVGSFGDFVILMSILSYLQKCFFKKLKGAPSLHPGHGSTENFKKKFLESHLKHLSAMLFDFAHF